MSWFLIAILAYFLFAVVNLTDKFLIDNVLRSSKAYVFSVCSLGALVLLAAPWFLQYPGIILLVANISTGGLFAVALFLLFESLRRGEAARTIILIGGLIPVFSALFSWLLFGQVLVIGEILGLVCLLIGIFLVALLPGRHSFWEKIWRGLRSEEYIRHSYLLIVLAAIFYALFFVATKYVYSFQSFWSAFIWVRLGAFIAVLLLFLHKKSRTEILHNVRGGKNKKHKKKNILLFLINQLFGSLAFILQNYAIFLGPVALINALQGFQYGVMMFFTFFLGFFYKEYKEKFSVRIFIQKIIALGFISVGLYIVALYS